MTPQPKLQIKWVIELDKYDGMNRQMMDKMGIWSNFQMSKSLVIKYALRTHPDTLFLDCDIIITHCINGIDMSKDIGVSPQFISKRYIDETGYYNGGMLWTKNTNVPDDWILFTKKSRYFDQASIEDLVKKYSHFEFGEEYNLQAWRMYLSNENKQTIANHITSSDTLYYKNKPLRFIHTHFHDARFKQFNECIIHHLSKSKMYKVLAIIYRPSN